MDETTGPNYDGLLEVETWYNSWKNYMLVENAEKMDATRIEEVFYLMILMIDLKMEVKYS